MIHVDHYGLHRQDNLVFLHEDSGAGRCLNRGLEKLKSPFRVRTGSRLACPHRLLDPQSGPIVDHPFVRAMGPEQEGRVFHVDPKHSSWIWRLSALCPGTLRHVEPYWTIGLPKLPRLAAQLRLTNAAPLALIDMVPGDFGDAEALASLPRTRNLILSGPLKVPGSEILDPEGLDWNHDWRAEGARWLHHFIRRSEA